MTVSRDARVGRGYISRQGDTGSIIWRSCRDSQNIGIGAASVELPAAPGQIVFQDALGVHPPSEALLDNFILGYGTTPYRVKQAVDYSDIYTIASSGDAGSRAPQYVPEQVAIYAPLNSGYVRKVTAAGYTDLVARSAQIQQAGIARLGNVLVAQWYNGLGTHPLAVSVDSGVSWTPATGPYIGGYAIPQGICASNARFISTGQLTANDPRVAYSTNGTGWTVLALPDYSSGGITQDVVAIGDRVVCAGTRDPGNNTTRVHYSTDGGLTWANSGYPHTASNIVSRLLVAGSTFYLQLTNGGSYEGLAYYSQDGITWIGMPAPPTGTIARLRGAVQGSAWFVTSLGDTRTYNPATGWSSPLILATTSDYYWGAP